MKYYLTITFICCVLIKSIAQDEQMNSHTRPIGGIEKLALEYYKVDFSKEQRELLREVELEFIYYVDSAGIPKLEEVNGISDAAILDSLFSRTEYLPRFYPEMYDGEPQESLYFMSLIFPYYEYTDHDSNLYSWRQIKMEDLEYLSYSNERLDVVLGGLGNGFIGDPSEYLGFGGGFKAEVSYTGKKNIGGGLAMNIYGNTLKKDFPIYSQREQNAAPPTMLIGIGLHKIIPIEDRKIFMPQLELHYAIQNITPNLGDGDKEWTQFNGFSPGVVFNYMLQFGKSKFSQAYAFPSVTNHYLNIHVGIRAMLMNEKEATGGLWEFGIAYRLGSLFVKEYALKPH